MKFVDLKILSYKTALLVALALDKHIEDLHALSVHPSCMKSVLGDFKVTLCLNAAFAPKITTITYRSLAFELFPFSPPLGVGHVSNSFHGGLSVCRFSLYPCT